MSKRDSNKANWKKYGFEFLSIFIAVLSAFGLNNWNDNRRSLVAEQNILMEIDNGLEKDVQDIQGNRGGHLTGVAACNYFRDLIQGKEVNRDSVAIHYFNLLRDYIVVQNRSGYETLKSRGLELISNDSVRFGIISLYEYDYNTLQKLEEEYSEMQYHKNYFIEIDKLIGPHLQMNEQGLIKSIKQPLSLSEEEKNKMLIYLWKIQANRSFILPYYELLEGKIERLRKEIQAELNS